MKDFTFIVKGQRFQTCRIIVAFSSPRISEYHFIDELINKFNINTNISSKNYFSDILSLVSFRNHQIKKEQLKFYINIFYLLDNKQEFLKLILKHDDEITINNIFERMHANKII